MINNAKIGVVILAAGSSSRLGYPKQLVTFRGKVLLQHIIDVANSIAFDSKVLVLGANSSEINEKLELRNFEVVLNNNWQEGMASSIREGIEKSLILKNGLEHLLILLSDQPFVTSENIQKLIKVQMKSNSQATFSEYARNVGVPAIFSSEAFLDLQKLEGDQGAKKLIYKANFNFQTVTFEKGNFDVDTVEDVELLMQMEKE